LLDQSSISLFLSHVDGSAERLLEHPEDSPSSGITITNVGGQRHDRSRHKPLERDGAGLGLVTFTTSCLRAGGARCRDH
jgi:hypothetical protein